MLAVQFTSKLHSLWNRSGLLPVCKSLSGPWGPVQAEGEEAVGAVER